MFRPLIVRLAPLALVFLAAPLAGQANRGGASPSAAVEEFIRAASDSNLARMAQLFGTDKGSAARTGKPEDFARRMVVVQAALSGSVVRANGEVLSKKRGALNARVLPGDIVFVPVRTQGNTFWARFKDITQTLFQLGLSAATVAAIGD